jgi:hypothetical protein
MYVGVMPGVRRARILFIVQDRIDQVKSARLLLYSIMRVTGQVRYRQPAAEPGRAT